MDDYVFNFLFYLFDRDLVDDCRDFDLLDGVLERNLIDV